MWLKRNERGLTLVEVLVAAVILGIIAVGLFTTFDVSARLAAAARQETKAVNLAQGKLEELRAVPYEELGDESGSVDNFVYKVTVEPTGYNTKKVTVTVKYPLGNTWREFILTTERSNL